MLTNNYLQVPIESDKDAKSALVAFREAQETGSDVEYHTIHIEECVEVVLERANHKEPLEELSASCYSTPSQAKATEKKTSKEGCTCNS